MQPLQALLRRACAQLGPRGVSDAAHALCSSPALAGLMPGPAFPHFRALSSATGILSASAPAAYATARRRQGTRPAGGWPALLLGPPASRSFHGSAASLAAAADDSSAAAVRRLAAARLRRERQAEAAAASAARGGAHDVAAGGEGGAPVADTQQQHVTVVVPASTTAVTPVEGRATEAQLAAALDHPALIVTRPIEWGTVIFGYEQANKYTVYDERGSIVALVAEDFGGFGKEVGRQLLRTRRSFTATVFSADGSQVLFRLRRPAYLISSTMFVEDGAGNPLGEIHQRWNLIKRNYDLYDSNKSQFAAISGNFLAWEFELKDARGGTLALVDRNFSGFAKEIFTDAGKYVIHFGYQGQQLQQHLEAAAQQQIQAQQQAALPPQSHAAAAASLQPPPQQQQHAAVAGGAPVPVAAPVAAAAPPPVTPMAVARTDVAVIPMAGGNQLVVARPLELSERMVALACAITIDYDYFSQHSHSGGGLVPPLVVLPGGGDGGGGEGSGAPQGEGPAAAGAAGAAAGAAGEVPLGGASGGGGTAAGGFGGVETPMAGSGGEAAGGDGSGGGDGFDSGRSWGEAGSGEGEMKWDLGGSGDGGGGGEEGGGGLTGLLGTIWGLFGGDD